MTNELHQRLAQLRADKKQACDAYEAAYFNPQNWQIGGDKRIISPLRPTPEGERIMTELAAPLRRLEREIAELEAMLPKPIPKYTQIQ